MTAVSMVRAPLGTHNAADITTRIFLHKHMSRISVYKNHPHRHELIFKSSTLFFKLILTQHVTVVFTICSKAGAPFYCRFYVCRTVSAACFYRYTTPALPSSSSLASAPVDHEPLPPFQRSREKSLVHTRSAEVEDITDPLLQMRQTLIDDPRAIYLGQELALGTLVGWTRDGRTDCCLRTDNLAAYTSALDSYRKNPDDHDFPLLPEPTLFSVIGRLCSEKFFMQADGNFTGSGQFSTRFADTKLSALIEPPDHPILSKDFKTTMSNLDTLVKSRRTRGYQTVKGLFDIVRGQRKYRIKHSLFTPRSEVDDDVEDYRPAQFTIAHWPINPRHVQAIEQLGEMINTHIVNFLPAFDRDGVLIEPAEYENALRGAIVSVHFTITHWTITGRSGGEGSDTFVLDVQDISVIEPPAPTSTHGRKRVREFMETDPFTVRKKRRVDENKKE
ncbi:hypothetical protein NM688_g559 [Phlebia brevispora]|uniref:Uncharacterized protein n=1 Tax=Phlebia brevispora TaxID=194682 RepID=A0ACC1TDZ1_9APHY|nr:hypothetical protein NM688_g559 [Phlebia brevispora]